MATTGAQLQCSVYVYIYSLGTLIDGVAIALVRAQMDLVDTYVIVCVKGHVRPPFALGQRVRRPPAAGLHAGSSTASDRSTIVDAGLQYVSSV